MGHCVLQPGIILQPVYYIAQWPNLSLLFVSGRCRLGLGEYKDGAAEGQPLRCLGQAVSVGLGQGLLVQVAACELAGRTSSSLNHTPQELPQVSALLSELSPYMAVVLQR